MHHHLQARTTRPSARTETTTVTRRILALAVALLGAASIAGATVGAASGASHQHGVVAIAIADHEPTGNTGGDPGS